MIGELDHGLRDAVEQELRMGFEIERANAFKRQIRLAQANSRMPRRGVDGLGQVTMSMDPVLQSLCRRQYGRDCFRDKGFVRELLRDNPELRVQYVKKAMVTKA